MMIWSHIIQVEELATFVNRKNGVVAQLDVRVATFQMDYHFANARLSMS